MEFGPLSDEIAGVEAAVRHLEDDVKRTDDDIALREAELGFPSPDGKNETERKAQLARRIKEDSILVNVRAERIEDMTKLAEAKANYHRLLRRWHAIMTEVEYRTSQNRLLAGQWQEEAQS